MSEFLLPPPKFITARKRSCGKVMFLHLSVSHSVNGGRGLCMMSLHVLLPGPIFLLEVESVFGSMFFPGGSLSLAPCSFQVGLCLWSHVPSWGVSLIDPLEQRPPGKRCPWTETPSGQRPPRQRLVNQT